MELSSTSSPDAAAELDRKVASLRRAEGYIESVPRVDSIETHFSWVFLTPAYVFKLKKPMRTAHLDYSDLSRRRHYCDEEVRLNRRLAPEVYRGIRPLLRRSDGSYRLAAILLQPGERCRHDAGPAVADWLVMMRRLPEDASLEQRLRDSPPDRHEIEGVAQVLAGFYQASEPVHWSGPTYRARLQEAVRRYREELKAPRFPLVENSVDDIHDWQLQLLHDRPELFDERVAHHHVVEGHGDLRPEHIFLTARPLIIDCLEFDRELRLLDAASELSFLVLECDRFGAADVGEALFSRYAEITGDRVPRLLRTFYEVQHACMRAAVALWHLDDPRVDDHSTWVHKARGYLRMAHQRAR